MEPRELIDLAGGPKVIATACASRNMDISRDQLTTWKARNAFPKTEWTGETSVVGVICELIRTLRGIDISPLEICPGAGQYMEAGREAA